MAQRSLNKVQLIGNLTRDPELRYTPQGTAVCSLGLATNRQWSTESGEKREEVEFHRLVAWNKLAEICSQLLFKGRRIFAEGRLQTRKWTAQDGSPRQVTEMVIADMIILDSKRGPGGTAGVPGEPRVVPEPGAAAKASGPGPAPAASSDDKKTTKADSSSAKKKKDEDKTSVEPEDIPF